MDNKIKQSYSAVVAQVAAAIAGVDLYAVPLTLSLVTPAGMSGNLTDLTAGETATKQAKAQLRALQLALKAAKADGRNYLFAARDVLKPQLGKQYSSAWDETGFLHSLEVPSRDDKVSAGLLALNAFFVAHPEYEVASLNVTAAQAATARNAFIAARNALNNQKTTWQLAMTTRDGKMALAREQLRALLKELAVRFTPLDERWSAFGFNKPGQLATPAMPSNVTVTLIGANAISVKWDKAARAEHYRVWKKVIGVDADYVHAGSPADLDFTIEGLPGNATVEVLVSAVNNGGESLRTTAIVVQTV